MAELSRRGLIAGISGAAASVALGFDRRNRSWIGEARAAGTDFAKAPQLSGSLFLDDASRERVSRDMGRIFHRVPAAVLLPANPGDIVAMVRFANENGLKVAVRGRGHSVYGQSLVEGGLLIDSSSLNTIESPVGNAVDVQPGALWTNVARVLFDAGLTPPVITTPIISVGGTLSGGGFANTSNRYGAQVDNVLELDVVTGDGRLITCSQNKDSELFLMTLAGMGHCAIIVRARLALIPAPTGAIVYVLSYKNRATFIENQATLGIAAANGTIDHQHGIAVRRDGMWTYNTQVGKFYTGPEPDLKVFDPILSGLSFDVKSEPVHFKYLDYVNRGGIEVTGGAAPPGGAPAAPKLGPTWSNPDIVAFVPKEAANEIADFYSSLSEQPGNIVRFNFQARNATHFKRPLVPLSHMTDPGPIFFDLQTYQFANDRAELDVLMQQNARLVDRVNAVGGRRYSPFMLATKPEWAAHFGPQVWQRLSAAKMKYDPHNILTPGTGMS
jgi:cytokinin dehydrogenase